MSQCTLITHSSNLMTLFGNAGQNATCHGSVRVGAMTAGGARCEHEWGGAWVVWQEWILTVMMAGIWGPEHNC